MTQFLLVDGRTVDGSVNVDFDKTHTNCVWKLTPEEYKMFVQGQLPDPPPAPPAPATEVTPRQARLALNAAGLLPQVEAAVSSADKATQITWEFATVVLRDDPLLAALAKNIGLTSGQIDGLFAFAATL